MFRAWGFGVESMCLGFKGLGVQGGYRVSGHREPARSL